MGKFALILAIVGFSGNLLAADVGINPKRYGKALRDSEHIYIVGEIKPNDYKGFVEAVSSTTARTVYVSSPGGDVATAIKIGLLIREKMFTTVLDGSCASACFLIYMGGVQRLFDGPSPRIGLHRPAFVNPDELASLGNVLGSKKYRGVREMVEDYLSLMNTNTRVIEDMMNTPSNDMYFPDRDYLNKNNIFGRDSDWDEWSRSKRRSQLGEQSYNREEIHNKCFEASLNEYLSRYGSEGLDSVAISLRCWDKAFDTIPE